LATAAVAIYFDDSADYGSALWRIVRALGGEEACEVLGNDEAAAYRRYCAGVQEPS